MKTILTLCQDQLNHISKRYQGNIKGLLLFCLFFGAAVHVSFAQAPSCNLSGPLKGQYNKAGGSSVNLRADVSGAVQGTTYNWTFNSNSSGAVIVSGQGTPIVRLKAGTQGGSFAIMLTVTNPGQNGDPGLNCTCVTSVSVNKK